MQSDYPRIVFPPDFNERDEWEMERKGYVHAIVEVSADSRYEVCFYDPVRLALDLEASVQCGIPCVADIGMIVVADVTRAKLESAVAYVVNQGFFESLKPMVPNAANKAVNPSGGSGGI